MQSAARQSRVLLLHRRMLLALPHCPLWLTLLLSPRPIRSHLQFPRLTLQNIASQHRASHNRIRSSRNRFRTLEPFERYATCRPFRRSAHLLCCHSSLFDEVQ